MTRPRISVIIPAYRAQDTIGDAIGSVLRQGREDVEVIVVDDASPDGTVQAARAAAGADDGEVRVLPQASNAGVAAARNAGVRAARGDVVVFLDADDVQLPGLLDRVDRELTGDVDALVVGHRVRSTGPVRNGAPRALGRHSGEAAALLTMRDAITPFPWDKAFRRELLGEVPFPEGIQRFEDLVSVIVFLSRARQVVAIDDPLIEYRVSAGSLTWGRVPTREERDAALQHLHTQMDPGLLSTASDDVSALRVLLTVLIAQSAALGGTGDGATPVLRACRADVRVGDIVRTARRNPVAAVAATVLRISPRLFSAMVRLRTRARYGDATDR